MTHRTYAKVLVAMLIAASVLRFWNFPNRLSLYSDAARDALVGFAAIQEHQLPLTGSFSSVGPFVFGPAFYYFIMVCLAASRMFIFAPWYGVAVLSVLFVLVIADTARQIGGRSMGIIAAILATISPAQVFRAVALTQHSVVGIASTCALAACVRYGKSKKSKWAFLMGIAAGIAASLHYQALSLLIIGGVVIIISWNKWAKLLIDGGLYWVGVLVPFFPLLFWDANQHWANVRNFLDYLLIGQFRIFVSRRWLTFLTSFLPDTWGSITSGNKMLGAILLSLVLLIIFYRLIKRKISLIWGWILIVFGVQVVVFRYFRGEIFEGYLLSIHPFILVFSAWALSALLSLHVMRKLTLILFGTIILSALVADIRQLSEGQNIIPVINETIDSLTTRFPYHSFVPYDFQYNSTEFTYSLSLMLLGRNLVGDREVPIVVCLWSCLGHDTRPDDLMAHYGTRTYGVVEVSHLPTPLDPTMLYNLAPSRVLKDVGFWWKEKPLESTFSLQSFIRNDVLKLH